MKKIYAYNKFEGNNMIVFTNEILTVFESQIYKTTSTVIATDDCVIVVDPALLPLEIDEIRKHVLNIKESRPVYLIFTHSDWDHIVGASHFPEATIIASEALTLKNKEEIIEQVKYFDDQYYIERDLPVIFPEVEIKAKEDGEQLTIGNTTLTFYLAKGHTDDGIFTIVEPYGYFIAGDYLSNIEFPFIYSSSEDYIKTLENVESILNNHQIHMLIPGHGHIAFSTEEILKRKHDSLQYINNLKKALQRNSEHEHLISPYSFKKGLKECHWENVKFLLKEFKNKK